MRFASVLMCYCAVNERTRGSVTVSVCNRVDDQHRCRLPSRWERSGEINAGVLTWVLCCVLCVVCCVLSLLYVDLKSFCFSGTGKTGEALSFSPNFFFFFFFFFFSPTFFNFPCRLLTENDLVHLTTARVRFPFLLLWFYRFYSSGLLYILFWSFCTSKVQVKVWKCIARDKKGACTSYSYILVHSRTRTVYHSSYHIV